MLSIFNLDPKFYLQALLFFKIPYFINFKVWVGSVVRFFLCEPQDVSLDLYTLIDDDTCAVE